MDGDAQLYSKDDTGEYVEYTAPTFQESLPDDLRENDHLKGFDNLGTLAKNYVDLRSSQPVLPESADQYKFDYPHDFPDNMKDPETLAAFRELSHKLKIPIDTAKQIFDFDISRSIAAQAKSLEMEKDKEAKTAAALTEAETKLKTDWGDSYDENLSLALKGIDKFGGPDFKKHLDDTGLGNNPLMVKTFYQIGKAMSEDTLKPGEGGSDGSRPVDDVGRPMLKFPSMEK